MLIISIAQGAACAYVLALVVMAINAMSPRTDPVIRFSYLLFGMGSVDGLYSCMTAPTLQTVCMSAGIALFLSQNRGRCNAPKY